MDRFVTNQELNQKRRRLKGPSPQDSGVYNLDFLTGIWNLFSSFCWPYCAYSVTAGSLCVSGCEVRATGRYRGNTPHSTRFVPDCSTIHPVTRKQCPTCQGIYATIGLPSRISHSHQQGIFWIVLRTAASSSCLPTATFQRVSTINQPPLPSLDTTIAPHRNYDIYFLATLIVELLVA